MSRLLKIIYKFMHLAIVVSVILLLQTSICAQEKPPRPLEVFVSPIQGLSFGAIILGASGGTVSIDASGTRSSTGDVYLGNFGFSYTPALFEIEANTATLINILNGPNVVLTGSNGGTMLLNIGSSNPTSPFVITADYPSRTHISIGGTLIIGDRVANPAGSYSGTFMITFIQE